MGILHLLLQVVVLRRQGRKPTCITDKGTTQHMIFSVPYYSELHTHTHIYIYILTMNVNFYQVQDVNVV